MNEVSVSNFGHIYTKALFSHLQQMGTTLTLVRQARHETIDFVAAMINIQPKILQQIEEGKTDFRIKTLFALCDYYDIDLKTVVGKGEFLKLKVE